MSTNTIYNNHICAFCNKQCKNSGALANHNKYCDLNPTNINKNYECKSVFLNNKYTNLYFNIISSALKNYKIHDGYFEYHHILPISLGGSDDKSNIIKLTPRQHFLCHYLLTKMLKADTTYHRKMCNAFIIMASNPTKTNNRYMNSKLYNEAKTIYSNIRKVTQKGENNSMFGKIWITNATLKENRIIHNNEIIPEGWFVGRCNYSTTKPAIYNNGIVEKEFYKFNVLTGFKKGKLKPKKEKIVVEKMNLHELDWELIMYTYNNYGFESIKIIYNIDFKSRNNLMMQSKRYNKNHHSNQKTKKNAKIIAFKY